MQICITYTRISVIAPALYNKRFRNLYLKEEILTQADITYDEQFSYLKTFT